MKKRMALIAGWAHPGETLKPIADLLEGAFETSLHAASDPFSPSEPTILLGWSLGGMLALEFAARHPELVSGLVLIGTTPRFTITSGIEYGTPEASLIEMIRQLTEDAKTTLQGFLAYAALPHRPGKRELIQRMEALQQGLHYLRTTDLRADIPNIKCPALLLHGRQDAVIPRTASEWLLEHLANAKLVTVENMGHDLPLRRPEWIAREIRAFFP